MTRPTPRNTAAAAVLAVVAFGAVSAAAVSSRPAAAPVPAGAHASSIGRTSAVQTASVAGTKSSAAASGAPADPVSAAPLATVDGSGMQLPGGGRQIAGRRLVAMYGHPGSAVLGVLGEQGLPASVARAKRLAAPYAGLSTVPVIPTFEIIATVATAGAGPDGNYSSEWPASKYEAWVDAATDAGMYVVLDLQPGRARLIDQAKLYESLLLRPNVGLAIDPEWKLQKGERPLHQIGHVDAAEINEVVTWLAQLTATNQLPQKMLVLHQFRLDMIRHRDRVDTSHPELALVIHADGQGGQGAKQATWRALRRGAPAGVAWGWKNFYDEDHPMLSPAQTMKRVKPSPILISYQ